MQSKLWQTTDTLDQLIEEFTVGDDTITDLEFLPYDIEGTLGHGTMLHSIGILTDDEYGNLQKGCQKILDTWNQGEFSIEKEQEDCHTAIEAYLTKNYGELGKKIHTGRSRNDQSLTMIRLFLRDSMNEAKRLISELQDALKKRVTEDNIVMPGYTHWQKAMPTDTRTWLGSFYDAIVDQSAYMAPYQEILDQSPLGSAAGFGIASFRNKRDISAAYMGFSRVQENPMYCGLSRGLFEHNILSILGNILMVVSRLNNDILLFTTSEFGFMRLPDNMTTGSSIMPQKRNYDVCELVRSQISLFFGYADQMRNIYTHLMSGYQRDLQMTKNIYINAYRAWGNIIKIYTHIINELIFDKNNLEKSITPDLLLTDEVYKLVSKGIPFREAYKIVKEEFFKKF